MGKIIRVVDDDVWGISVKFGTNLYLKICRGNKRAFLIDPGVNSAE